MALRMTEEEYAEYQRRHNQQNKQRIDQKPDFSRQANHSAPMRCRSARVNEVSVTDMDAGNIAAAMERKSTPKRQKYGNKRVEIDGIKFDSQHEASIYQELMFRVRAGELKTVCRQVKFDLPGGIVYIADFVTIRPDFSIEGVYDAKSPATKQNRVYINKKKQMKACWGIEIQEV